MDRYRLYKRKNGIYYLEDIVIGTQSSLKTRDKSEAMTLFVARNQAVSNSMMNRELAKTYLIAQSPDFFIRTWSEVALMVEKSYEEPTLSRWKKFSNSEPFQIIKNLKLIETEGKHFLKVLNHSKGGVSTNVWLRILHNRALDWEWIMKPVLNQKGWPKIRYGKRRGITQEEHSKILEAEHDPQYRLYYELLWETGGSQTDIANLRATNIDWRERRLYYDRKKLDRQNVDGAILAIGSRLEKILRQLPSEGLLFPELALRAEVDRASRFRKVRIRANVEGVTLHSYRYGWAERAMTFGMPEREAMSHLGHNSRAVHQAYARNAKRVTLPLEVYEKQMHEKIIQLDLHYSSESSNEERLPLSHLRAISDSP